MVQSWLVLTGRCPTVRKDALGLSQQPGAAPAPSGSVPPPQPPDWASSLASVGVIATSRSGPYGVPVAGFLDIDTQPRSI